MESYRLGLVEPVEVVAARLYEALDAVRRALPGWRADLGDDACLLDDAAASYQATLPGSDLAGEQHVFLQVEVPAFETGDLDEQQAYRLEFESDSEWLLCALGLGGPVRLRLAVEGEDSAIVVEMWGHVHSARLGAPGRGYDRTEPKLTEEQLEVHGQHLLAVTT